MRTNRSIRNRGKRKRSEVLDLDITSLLDILVILLVFLLKSYSSSGVILNVPKGISLPESESKMANTSGVIIQMSQDKIWVDDKEIVDLVRAKKDKSYNRTVFDVNRQGRRIIPLYNELVRKKQMIKRIEKSAPDAKKFSGIINLIVDKTLKYNDVRRLMYTAAEAGFKQYKFVVLGNENAN